MVYACQRLMVDMGGILFRTDPKRLECVFYFEIGDFGGRAQSRRWLTIQWFPNNLNDLIFWN